MFKSLLLKLRLMASSIWDFLRPVIMEFLSDVGPELAELALESVKALATTDLTNEEKRQQAFDSIKAKFLAKGIKVRDSLINLAVEIAVQKLKSE